MQIEGIADYLQMSQIRAQPFHLELAEPENLRIVEGKFDCGDFLLELRDREGIREEGDSAPCFLLVEIDYASNALRQAGLGILPVLKVRVVLGHEAEAHFLCWVKMMKFREILRIFQFQYFFLKSDLGTGEKERASPSPRGNRATLRNKKSVFPCFILV